MIAESFDERRKHSIKILHSHLLLGQQMVLTLDIVQGHQYKVRQALQLLLANISKTHTVVVVTTESQNIGY